MKKSTDSRFEVSRFEVRSHDLIWGVGRAFGVHLIIHLIRESQPVLCFVCTKSNFTEGIGPVSCTKVRQQIICSHRTTMAIREIAPNFNVILQADPVQNQVAASI